MKFVSDSGKKLKTTAVFLSPERGMAARRGFYLSGHWSLESVLKFCASKNLNTEFLEIQHLLGHDKV